MIDDLDGVDHAVFLISGDGNCLSSSLAHIVYGADSREMEVRYKIVDHVVQNWNRFRLFSSTAEGYNYNNVKVYTDDMNRKETFSITINKVQGQTLEEVGIYLPKPVFSHGQIYVAFSRVRNNDDVKLKVIRADGKQGMLKKDCTSVFSKNIVFKEVF